MVAGVREFAKILAGGDRRSIGEADAVAAAVAKEPGRFPELWTCLSHGDGVVRMRAADALEKLSRSDIALFRPHKKALLSGARDDGTSEVRWHLVVLMARLPLTEAEAKTLCIRLDDYLRNDDSRIVRANALEAACEVAKRHPALAEPVQRMMAFARGSSWPSLKARARKLASQDKPRSARIFS